MSWKKKKKVQEGKNKYYSLSNKLKKESRSHDEFEVMLNNLSLEEIIGLKLELAARSVGNMLYGLPILTSLPYITRATRSKKEAARFLDINLDHLKKLLKKHDTESYFENIDKK